MSSTSTGSLGGLEKKGAANDNHLDLNNAIDDNNDNNMDANDDGVLFESHGGNEADDRFDQMIGVLEDYIIDPSFGSLQNDFFKAHMDVFVDMEENKLEYTPIHQKYVDLLEASFATRLTRDVPHFDMTEFLTMIEDRKEEIPGDIMDLLSSLDDFEMFKSMILAFKRENSTSSTAATTATASAIAVRPLQPSAAAAKSSSGSNSSSLSLGGLGISGTSIARTSTPLTRSTPSSTAATSSTSTSSRMGGLGLDLGISGKAIRK